MRCRIPPRLALRRLTVLAVPAFLALPLAAGLALPQDPRRPLTVADGDGWRTLAGVRLARAGEWILYQLQPADGDDGELHLVATEGEARYVIARGAGGRFDPQGSHAACLVKPAREALRAWRKASKEREESEEKAGEGKAPEEQGEPGKQGEGEEEADREAEPKDALAILDLVSGERVDVERVQSFQLPEEAGGWIAYLLEKEPPEKNEKKERAEEGEEPGEIEPAAPPEPPSKSEPEAEDQKKDKKKKDKEPGTDLVLRNLASGEERTFPHVASYAFPKDGRHLAFITSTEDGKGDGLFLVDLASGATRALLEGQGDYRSIAFDESSTQIAFLSNRDDYQADEPRWTLYHARLDGPDARAVASAGTPGIPEGWGVGPHRAPTFSESGRRLLFGTAPLPEPEPEEIDEEERVVLDVWSWTDDLIQPVQLQRREQELERSYLALVHLVGDPPRVVQLGSPEVPEVSLALEGDSVVAMGTSDRPYRHMVQWDPDVYRDAYLIDATSGETRRVIQRRRGRFRLSPGGRWIYWWDGEQRQWFALSTQLPRAGSSPSGSTPDPEPVCLTESIPQPLWNELHDTPALPRAYGEGGWLAGDVGLIVYDRHDLWLVDPQRRAEPFLVTEGVGRRENLRLRRVDLDPDDPFVSPMEELLLSAFQLETKRAGFWRDRLLGGEEPRALIMDDKRFSTPVQAEEADLVRFTREAFGEFPDLWVADLDLAEPRRLSDANPQQADFLWGSAELVSWRSTDGTPLQGILYKPEGFDPQGRYPLLVYFYERSSDGLHRHNAPIASRSTIRFPYYTSNGYCIFVPDIPYRVGYPGASCAAAVLPGILSLIDAGFVDEHAIGVQGHSWGGYQIAYLVTQTDLFAAAVAGAPVSNMTSAYGGIRWGSGMSRQFQYEKTQSRLGGSLWEVPNRYFENSPLFFADKVHTPLLMLHNDEDGAVPWTQGIEYFVALRRLQRPVWMLNYNGEGHGIGKYAHKRDYALRMSQFFDHFLRGAPAPVWMVEGIPAVAKGRTLGLELVGEAE